MEVDLYRSLSASIPKNWAKEGKEGK